MARKVKDATLDSREARSRLKVRGKPYWRAYEPRLHIGYRRIKGKAGTWVARYYLGAEQYRIESLGTADDFSDKNGATILDFGQAQTEARRRRDQRAKEAAGEVTVGTALDAYEPHLKVRGRSAENVQRVRVHMPADLSALPVALLSTPRLQSWRDGLRKKMAATSVDRVCNALRAALNLAADHSDGKLSRHAWEIGLKSISGGSEPRNVVISDAEACRVVAEAWRESDQFGLLVELAAVTGARPIQLASIRVRHVASDQIEIPSSRKGTLKNKKPTIAVPIATSLASRLREAARGKSKDAILLTKPSGEPWKKSDHARPFRRVAERAGLDPAIVTIYALRHSNITRQLKANVPIRVVAAAHDTSVAMIEKTYSAHIAKFSNDLLRPALLNLSTPTSGNVVNL